MDASAVVTLKPNSTVASSTGAGNANLFLGRAANQHRLSAVIFVVVIVVVIVAVVVVCLSKGSHHEDTELLAVLGAEVLVQLMGVGKFLDFVEESQHVLGLQPCQDVVCEDSVGKIQNRERSFDRVIGGGGATSRGSRFQVVRCFLRAVVVFAIRAAAVGGGASNRRRRRFSGASRDVRIASTHPFNWFVSDFIFVLCFLFRRLNRFPRCAIRCDGCGETSIEGSRLVMF